MVDPPKKESKVPEPSKEEPGEESSEEESKVLEPPKEESKVLEPPKEEPGKESWEEVSTRYFHATACGPGGIAGLNAKFAKKI